jgi:hypothetical protein
MKIVDNSIVLVQFATFSLRFASWKRIRNDPSVSLMFKLGLEIMTKRSMADEMTRPLRHFGPDLAAHP